MKIRRYIKQYDEENVMEMRKKRETNGAATTRMK